MAIRKIRLIAGSIEAEAQFNATATAQAVWDTLPLTAAVNTWGDEIYFQIPVSLELEHGQETVEMGALGYWPPGRAFCIFFGPTPASRGDEIRPASAVTVIGKVTGDAAVFQQVASGASLTIEKAKA